MIAIVSFFLWQTGTNSQIKLKLNVPGRTLSECNARYSANLVRLTDNQLCAGGEKGRDSCRGMCTFQMEFISFASIFVACVMATANCLAI